MATSYDVDSMLEELEKLGVNMDVAYYVTPETKYNYIIHMYDVMILNTYQFKIETAEILCTLKLNKQPWQRAYRS